MDPREYDDLPFDNSDDQDTDRHMRHLRGEKVRLEAQIDQLQAAERERSEEVAALRARLMELEGIVQRLRTMNQRSVRRWKWIVAVLLGIWALWLLRLW
jgi:chromosome segregation ATPase